MNGVDVKIFEEILENGSRLPRIPLNSEEGCFKNSGIEDFVSKQTKASKYSSKKSAKKQTRKRGIVLVPSTKTDSIESEAEEEIKKLLEFEGGEVLPPYSIMFTAHFAKNKNLYTLIDCEYEKHKNVVVGLIESSSLKDEDILHRGTPQYELMARKVLGLLLYNLDYYVNLFFSRENPKLQKYITNSEHYKEGNVFSKVGMSRKDFSIENIIYCYYMFKENKEAKRKANSELLKGFTNYMGSMLEGFYKDGLVYDSDISMDGVDEFWERYTEETGVSRDFTDIADFVKKHKDTTMYDKVFNSSIKKILDNSGVGFLTVDVEVSLEDINLVTSIYLSYNEGVLGFVEFFVEKCFMLKVAKSYTDLKKTYLNENSDYLKDKVGALEFENQRLIKDLSSIENKHTKEISDKNSIIKRLSGVEKKLKQEYESKVSKLHKEYKAEIAKLKSGYEKTIKENEKKIESLSLSKSRLKGEIRDLQMKFIGDEEDSKMTMDEAIAVISSFNRILYVADLDFGMPRLKVLKEKLPMVDFYDGTFPSKADIVFTDIGLMHHSLFWKTENYYSSLDTPIHLIKSSGLESKLVEMATSLKELERLG
jgi:hypothetical protein